MTARRRGSKRRAVVLFQPRDEGWAMPLGLLAVGSWLTGEHVVIVDGRFELAPEARIAGLAADALCLGVTVRTGEPLREALRTAAAARAASPELAVVWGGAHAALDPRSCLSSGVVDACVPGAGEEAMSGVVEALRGARPLASVAGLTVASGEPATPAGPPAHLWPRADYSLLDLERHFEARGSRTLDYCSSRGARDGATWTGLRAERVLGELGELAERHRLAEVLFRDEDFFADPERVEAIAAGLADAGGSPAWQAGARAEDVVECPPERLRLLAESGCRKVHVSATRGAVALDALLEAGSRLRTAGLAARFAFEVEDPRGGTSALGEAIAAARALSALDPSVETPLLRARVFAAGESRSLEEWARDDGVRWSNRAAEARLARAAFYLGEAQRPPGRRLGKHLVRLLALVRVRLGLFGLDVERRAVDLSAHLRTGRPRRNASVD